MTRKTERKHLRELAPFALLYEDTVARIESATDRQLSLWRKSVLVPTETNCGWATYRVSGIVQNLVIEEQQRRAYQKSKSKKKP